MSNFMMFVRRVRVLAETAARGGMGMAPAH
jgi:hypothetical protein